MQFINFAGYKFVPLERLPELKAGLDPAAQRAPAVTPAELKRWLDGNLNPELAGAQ